MQNNKEVFQMLPRNSGKSLMYGGAVAEVPPTREQRRMMERERKKQVKKHTREQKKIARKLGFIE